MGALLGYIGKDEASKRILRGLAKVSYKGRDGLGIATLDEGSILRRNSEKELKKAVKEKEFTLDGGEGIGGIRFATHGRPTIENTPPFFDCDKEFAVITKGVIANFGNIKENLSEKGHIFKSRNDAEIVPHLIEAYSNGTFQEALERSLKRLKGPFSLLMLAKNPEAIVAYSQEFELFFSKQKDGRYVGSEPEMLESHYSIQKNKAVILTPDKTRILTLEAAQAQISTLDTLESLEKASPRDFENFMVREIHNQPYALKVALGTAQEKYVNLITRMISKGGDIFLTGCGTSYHAALLGGYLFREIADLSPSAVNAAEFRYYTLKSLEPGAILLAISQSGKTTDLLRTIRDAKIYGASIIGILNHLATPLMYSSNLYLPIGVGEENAIPATKSFLGSLVCLYKIALNIARKRKINLEIVKKVSEEMEHLPQVIRKTIEQTEPIIEQIAPQIKNQENIFVLGRGIDLPVALEGSLKLKEAAHIHSEGMTAGELRHGSITLLTKGIPAIFLIPQEKDAKEDTYNLIAEANEAGGECIIVTQEKDVKAERISDKVVKVPNVTRLLSPFVNIIPLQLLSYKLGNLRGIETDKPKALSKSVILEDSLTEGKNIG